MTGTSELPRPTRKFLLEHKLQILAVCIWILIILSFRFYLSYNHVHFFDVVKVLESSLHDHWYGPVIYFLMYIIRPILFIPATFLTILAGSIWGVKLGYLYAIVGGVLSSIAPYLLGRWFHLRTKASPQVKRNLYGLERFITNNAFESILVLRLLYMPYDIVSFVAGILELSFWSFVIATFVGDLAGTLTFVSIGSSLQLREAEHGLFAVHYSQIALSLGIMCVTIALSQFIKRVILKKYGRKPPLPKDI